MRGPKAAVGAAKANLGAAIRTTMRLGQLLLNPPLHR